MTRPKFFLSSTIYDFKDLRSAVKYYLEQQGCTVLASEWNDFPKSNEDHSYDECLKTVHQADYFVLFIGARVGGWFDEKKKTSITQREYREAYQLHLDGKLKIITFVRSDVWTVREDRKALRNFLESLPLDASMRNDIASHPSKFVDDAKWIASFISEVSKNKETKQSLEGSAPLPTGNWVHVFQDFRDVIDVLRTQAFGGIPVEHAGLRRLLLRELKEILSKCLIKTKGKSHSPEVHVAMFYEEHRLTRKTRENPIFSIQKKRWNILSSIGISYLGLKFQTRILQAALESTAFLTYDNESSSLRETQAYEFLSKLSYEIGAFNKANTSDVTAVIFEYSPKNYPTKRDFIEMDTIKLFLFLHMFDRLINIIKLSTTVALYLQDGIVRNPQLRPFSILPGMDEEIEAERTSIHEVDAFLANAMVSEGK